PVLDVGRVTRLRHFAVTDYGNARFSLLGHNCVHGSANLGGKQQPVDWLSFLFGVHGLNQLFRAREAAHMSCQEVINAVNHRAQMVLVLCKRLIVFPPTHLMERSANLLAMGATSVCWSDASRSGRPE